MSGENIKIIILRIPFLSIKDNHLKPLMNTFKPICFRFYIFYLLILFIFFASCTSSRKLSYFTDRQTDSSFTIPKSIAPQTILKGDILYIMVASADLASNAVFNSINNGGNMQNANVIYSNSPGYLVEEDGTFSFPRIGKISAVGKTKAHVKTELEQALLPYLKDPTITIRNLNYRITLLGEVTRPGIYTSLNERMTILEALGQAGDLTEFGKRDNVLLIRETELTQEYYRINLNDRSSIKPEFYYLRPNDVLYVEPINTKKVRSSNIGQVGPLALSSLSLLITLLLNLR